ncbi:MAG TPA: hypothetical protein VF201_10895 [Nitrolancea sp.]
MLSADAVKPRLAHVLWLGGPPDSGKTTIASEIGARHRISVYHFDRHEPAHFARADPTRHPALYAAHPDRMSTEERWLGSAPEVMARETMHSWTERFGMALDDLLEAPSDGPIIAEGPGIFPECLAPLLSDPRRALWLVPTPTFKRASAIRRDKPGNRWETSDPARAQQNLIERDLLMGEHVQRSAEALGLTVYLIDGSIDLDGMIDRVEAYFAPWLP